MRLMTRRWQRTVEAFTEREAASRALASVREKYVWILPTGETLEPEADKIEGVSALVIRLQV